MNPGVGHAITKGGVARGYATVASIVVGLLFYSNWPTYQFIVLGGPVPLVFYACAMALAGGLAWLRPYVLMTLVREPLFYWFVLYAATGLIWVVFGEGYLDPENREWRLRFLLLLLFAAGLVLSTMVNFRWYTWVLVAAMVLSTLTYWHDFLNPFYYVPQDVPGSNPGRGAGLFINANQAGDALIALGIAAMPFIRGKWRAWIVILVMLGVVPTFSRSSILFAVMVLGVWLWYGQFRRTTLIIFLTAMPLAAVMGYNLFNTAIKSDEINLENVMGRVEFFLNWGDAQDDSSSERAYVAELGWVKFSESPLTGIGVGATDAGVGSRWGYRVATHNMFLRLMVDQGMLGGALYLGFLALIFLRGLRLARSSANKKRRSIGVALLLMGLYFSVIGVFSHTLLQEPVSILTLAFLTAASHRVDASSI